MMDKNKGFLHCRGKDIVDGDGNRFQALGFGLGGTFYPEGYMWQVFGGPELPEKFCESPTYIFNGIQEIVGYEWAKKFWDRYLENWTTEEDIKTMAKWGANHIRLPLTYKTLTDKDGSYLESGFDDIERSSPGAVNTAYMSSWTYMQHPVDRIHGIFATATAPPGYGKNRTNIGHGLLTYGGR